MKQVAMISNGDFRNAVGESCWPKQEETLLETEQAFTELGVKTYRAHPFNTEKKHGFITTQAECCRIFAGFKPTDEALPM